MYCIVCSAAILSSLVLPLFFSFTRHRGQALPPDNYDDINNFNEENGNNDDDCDDVEDDDDEGGDKIKFFHLLLFLVLFAAGILHHLHQF